MAAAKPENQTRRQPSNRPGNRWKAFIAQRFSGESISSREIVAIIIPIIVDQAFVVGLNLINTALISSSGVAALSAVNMVDAVNMLLINVFIAVATGGTVVVAQYKGSGNDSMPGKATAGAISASFLLAFGIGLLTVGGHGPLLSFLFGNADADVLRSARVYMVGCGISYTGLAVKEAVCGALRGVGETRSSLLLSLVMNALYVAFNLVLVSALHMGVWGLAISVNISRYLAAAFSIFFLMRINRTLHFRLADTFRLELSMLRKILFIGVPFAAEQLFFQGGKILTQTFIVRLGTYAIATNAICNTITSVIQIPALALSLAVVAVVGQCIGHGSIPDARKFIRSFLMLSSVSFVGMVILMVPIYYPMLALFHPPARIIPDITRIELITSVALIPLWSISFVTPSALRAAGDSRFTSLVAMLSMWLFRVVLGYILGIVLPFGIVGVWVAMDCEWGVRGVIFLRRFHGKKWYAHHLID